MFTFPIAFSSFFLFFFGSSAHHHCAITLDPRTWLCHISNVHPLLLCHEAQDGKYCEARHKTGTTVEGSQQQTVPMSHICHEEDLLMNTQGSLYPPLSPTANPLPENWCLTCSSCICTCCSSPRMSWRPNRWHRRRRSECRHQSIPAELGGKSGGQKGWGLLMKGSSWQWS